MAYGITVEASGGQFQIDSDLTGTRHLVIQGPVRAVPAAGTVTIGGNDRLFVRATSTDPYINLNWNAAGTVCTFTRAANYIICRPSDSTTHASVISSTAHGLQVKNGSGAVCFDSRALEKGLSIISVHAKGTLQGGDINGHAPNQPSVPAYLNPYPNNNSVYVGAVGGPALSARKIYVSAFGNSADGYPTTIPSQGEVHSGFFFDFTGNKILHRGWLRWSGGSAFYSGLIPVSNQSEIIVGEILE
tara:strand:+ start:1123 stop:1857 length:735 start_codon:yes stop_codon:yes gene_type:complete